MFDIFFKIAVVIFSYNKSSVNIYEIMELKFNPDMDRVLLFFDFQKGKSHCIFSSMKRSDLLSDKKE